MRAQVVFIWIALVLGASPIGSRTASGDERRLTGDRLTEGLAAGVRAANGSEPSPRSFPDSDGAATPNPAVRTGAAPHGPLLARESKPDSRPQTGPASRQTGGAKTGPARAGDGADGPTRPETPAGPEANQGAGPPGRADFGWFNFQPLDDWETRAAPGGTQMRRAEYRIPAAEGDSEDGRLVVYFFGLGQGGSTDANLARWRGQMRKPDGMSDEEHCLVSKQKVDGLNVTIAELRGTYDPGSRFQEKPTPGHMMLAAIVETAGGNYFIHTIGPEKTLLACRSRWYTMMLDLKAGSAGKP